MAGDISLGQSTASGLSAGISIGFSTGNPYAGILAGSVAFFSDLIGQSQAANYNAELAAIASLNEKRQTAAAQIQLDMNEQLFEHDMFAAERNRKALSYRATMANAGVTAYAQATGTEGSSVQRQAQTRLTTQEARGRQDSIRSQLLAESQFDMAQERLEILAGFRDFQVDPQPPGASLTPDVDPEREQAFEEAWEDGSIVSPMLPMEPWTYDPLQEQAGIPEKTGTEVTQTPTAPTNIKTPDLLEPFPIGKQPLY